MLATAVGRFAGDAAELVAKRLRDDPKLADAVATWLEARPVKPETVSSSDWLRFEHDKCRKLLASAAA